MPAADQTAARSSGDAPDNAQSLPLTGGLAGG